VVGAVVALRGGLALPGKLKIRIADNKIDVTPF